MTLDSWSLPVNVAAMPHDSANQPAAGEAAAPARAAPAEDFAHSPDYVQSLHRGLSVIRAFDAAHAALTLSQVAARAGLSRAVARRLLMTLEYLGYVVRNERHFSLTPRVLELGSSYLSSLSVAALAQPFMEEVARSIDESCSLAVLDESDVVYVQRVAVRKVMTITLAIGARLPAYCTSMGRMLLAGLEREALERWLRELRPQTLTRFTLTDKAHLRSAIERARLQDFAYVEQELQEGLCSVAVPVHDARGQIVAALNAGMPFRVEARAHALKKVLPVLRNGARSIERSLLTGAGGVAAAAHS
jgi:IclR family transcriptional regulator, pca regulon regulatory protein